jgi:hypothetical protein
VGFQTVIERAVSVSGKLSKKAAVTLALKEFIARREQCNIVGLFGKLEWDDSYDYNPNVSVNDPIR